jgi:uncharacterized membrane protein
MHEYRPEISLPKTTIQKITNIIGYSILIGCTIYSLVNIVTLPSEVPIHFNLAGEADGWGSKYVLLILPLIGLFSILALEEVEKRPYMHNYPAHINETNVRQFYAISIRTMNLVKNGLLLTFGLLQLEMVQSAKEANFALGSLLLPLVIVAVFVPIAWHIYSMVQIKAPK